MAWTCCQCATLKSSTKLDWSCYPCNHIICLRCYRENKEQLKHTYITPCCRVPFPGGTSAFIYLITHCCVAKLEEDREQEERERAQDLDALDQYILQFWVSRTCSSFFFISITFIMLPYISVFVVFTSFDIYINFFHLYQFYEFLGCVSFYSYVMVY